MSVLFSVTSVQDILELPYCNNSIHALENFFVRVKKAETEDKNFFHKLGRVFIRAIEQRKIGAVQLIIHCSRFSEIPTGESGLGDALIIAAYYKRVEELKLIIKCNRFSEIAKEYLNNALIYITDEECRNMIEESLKNRNLCNVS